MTAGRHTHRIAVASGLGRIHFLEASASDDVAWSCKVVPCPCSLGSPSPPSSCDKTHTTEKLFFLKEDTVLLMAETDVHCRMVRFLDVADGCILRTCKSEIPGWSFMQKCFAVFRDRWIVAVAGSACSLVQLSVAGSEQPRPALFSNDAPGQPDVASIGSLFDLVELPFGIGLGGFCKADRSYAPKLKIVRIRRAWWVARQRVRAVSWLHGCSAAF